VRKRCRSKLLIEIDLRDLRWHVLVFVVGVPNPVDQARHPNQQYLDSGHRYLSRIHEAYVFLLSREIGYGEQLNGLREIVNLDCWLFVNAAQSYVIRLVRHGQRLGGDCRRIAGVFFGKDQRCDA
jgi:hypothetical protein